MCYIFQASEAPDHLFLPIIVILLILEVVDFL